MIILAKVIDDGEAENIHPKDKEIVAERLVKVVEKVAYGKDIVSTGPTLSSMKIDNDKVTLFFDNIGSGLVKKGKSLDGFAISGDNKKWFWADAKIDGNSVVLYSKNVMHPIAVRYAWADNPISSLYNKEGLPAFPFRTDKSKN